MEKLKEYLLSDHYFKREGTLRDFVQSMLTDGTFQQIFILSDTVLEKYYQTSKSLLDQKRFVEASDAFFFLVFINPYSYTYWMGLGIAEQCQERYPDAAFAYLMAAAANIDDPSPYVNSAQVLLAMGEKNVAKETIDQALTCCQNKPEYESIKTKAIELQKVCS